MISLLLTLCAALSFATLQSPVPIGAVAQREAKASNGDGGRATRARIEGPSDLALDRAGNLYILEDDAMRIRKVDARTKIIFTFAGNGTDEFDGDGGPALKASLDNPTAIVIASNDDLFIAEMGGRIRRVDAATKVITTFAGNGKFAYGGVGDGGPAIGASFARFAALAFDSKGNLYIADDLDHRIRRIDTASGMISTVAGGGISISDGVLATEAGLRFPSGIALDRDDNLFISDTEHHLIRRVDARTKIITTIAGDRGNKDQHSTGPAVNVSLYYPRSLAIDRAGNVYVVDGARERIARIDASTGLLSTFAGGRAWGPKGDGQPAHWARLDGPAALAFNGTGDLFISEYGTGQIRRVDSRTGKIATVAGKRRIQHSSVSL